MGIISLPFALSSIISILIFYSLNYKYRIGFLTILSFGFIAGYNYYLLFYVVVFALINYLIGIKIPVSKFKIALFRTGIIFNLSQLILLKYASFAIDPVFQAFNSNLQVSRLSEIIIPIGISYFTLQGIGYLINIKMGWEKPEKRLLNFLLYIVFFPKFLSGPIERSNHFLPQLNINKPFNEKDVTDGLRIALFGFFKKVAIANQLSPFINSSYTNLNSIDGSLLWVLMLIQPLYLYFDFSGYTDIAIGFAKTFGIDLLPNFNRPFLSENVTTLWRRMHMSLSLWFNDYVFKQVSFRFRRWGKYASVFAVFITFTLFGIFHGAGWNFMFLGFAQALAINYEFFSKKQRRIIFSKLPNSIRIWSGRLFTYLFFSVSHVFFFAPNLNSAFTFFSKLTRISDSVMKGAYLAIPLSFWIFVVIYFFVEVIQNDYIDFSNKLKNFWSGEKKKSILFRWTVYSGALAIILVLGSEVQQFIYAQF